MWILSAAFVAILLRIFGKIIRRLLQMEREREFTEEDRKRLEQLIKELEEDRKKNNQL